MATKQRQKAKVKTKAKKVAAPRKRAPKVVAAPAQTFPVLAHILKGGDAIAVTLMDQAHLDRLVGEHGPGSVKVQP